jgi:hypothetical protein
LYLTGIETSAEAVLDTPFLQTESLVVIIAGYLITIGETLGILDLSDDALPPNRLKIPQHKQKMIAIEESLTQLVCETREFPSNVRKALMLAIWGDVGQGTLCATVYLHF